eukprot:tig00001065_g6713.t1
MSTRSRARSITSRKAGAEGDLRYRACSGGTSPSTHGTQWLLASCAVRARIADELQHAASMPCARALRHNHVSAPRWTPLAQGSRPRRPANHVPRYEARPAPPALALPGGALGPRPTPRLSVAPPTTYPGTPVSGGERTEHDAK